MDYVDLYLIHWPVSMKIESTNNSTIIVNFEMKEIWEEMEKCCRMGLAKSIGVSNFSTTKLSALLQIATIQPAVNQVIKHKMNIQFCILALVLNPAKKYPCFNFGLKIGSVKNSKLGYNVLLNGLVLFYFRLK